MRLNDYEMTMPNLLRLAGRVRLHSEFVDRLKVGAVLGRKGRALSVGFNKNKTHPSVKWSIHAEVDALLTAEWEAWIGATMYVYRSRRDGTPAISRPCDDCLRTLISYGIKKIVYTTDDPPYFNIENL